MTTAATKTVAYMISSLSPCEEAMTWAAGYTSAAKAWKECNRGDWMLWLVGKLSGPPESDGRKAMVLCACDCAELALKYTKDKRVGACIKTARQWAQGKTTIQELRMARTDAYAAAYAADAAYAAAYAADAAYAAADAAAAAYAAADAYAAYAADADADAKAKVLAACADIVRKHYPKPPKLTREEQR